MNEVRYSNRAKADLSDIGRYSVANWGPVRASRYLDELETCCELVSRSPGIGRKWHHKRRIFRRIEHASHVIFYTEEAYGVLVRRILHKSVLPSEHPFDES